MDIFKYKLKYFAILILAFWTSFSDAQNVRTEFNPCFLKDSVGTKLAFIRKNAVWIFRDTADCKDILLDSIAVKYAKTKDVKYLVTLTAIRQNSRAKADGLFTDAINLIAEADFTGFIDELYAARGKFIPLQNELIAAMNMIVNGRPVKQKYMGQLDMEIERAKNSKDINLENYLEKLKKKIEAEQYR